MRIIIIACKETVENLNQFKTSGVSSFVDKINDKSKKLQLRGIPTNTM